MLDCAIAGGRPLPDGRLISRLADDLAGGRLAALVPAPANRRDLLESLAGVSDGRPGRGRDHPVAAVLALAAAAVAAGSRSFTAIAGWAADVPADVLEGLYRRCGAAWPRAGPVPGQPVVKLGPPAGVDRVDAPQSAPTGRFPCRQRTGYKLTSTAAAIYPASRDRARLNGAPCWE